ncbi:hypothetical protein PRVXT_002219 [Proteinivorax tanatarense]|uniref:Ethanolamine utilization protein n=1 Tax=Proteinivorax tanatarense TaxID=1260629 RepID=A0AAU7VJI4_9FIRM
MENPFLVSPFGDCEALQSIGSDMVEIEKLVEKITKQVLQQVQQNSFDEKKEISKIICYIEEKDEVKYYEEISNFFQKQNMAKRFISSYTQSELEDAKYILIPKLSVSSMAFIATGIKGDLVSNLVLDALILGKQVGVLENGMEYQNHAKTCKRGLYQLYEGYKRKIQDLDIEVGSLNGLFLSKTPKTLIASRANIVLQERVITEKKLKDLDCKDFTVISIPEKSIITPMAKDFIRTHQIQIDKSL